MRVRAFYVARKGGVPRLRHEERINGWTELARCGAARSKSTDLVGALRRCITVGVTRASAGRPFRPLSPANVGITKYLLSVRASTLEGGRRVHRARICTLVRWTDLAASRRRHNGNDGAMRAKRYAKLHCAICPALHASQIDPFDPIAYSARANRQLDNSLNSSLSRA